MRPKSLSNQIISLVMALTFFFSCAFLSNEAVYAAGDDIASGTWGDCDWVIDADGILTISAGTLPSTNGPDDEINVPWYPFASEITEVRFNGTVHLSEQANFLFADCVNMTSFDASGLDTSGVAVARAMFLGCLSLRDIDTSDWDTSNMTFMSEMFSGCQSLKSLNVSKWDTSKVTDMSYLFAGCSFESLDVS